MDETEALAASTRFVQIDEDGYFVMEDLRVSDPEIGRAWLHDLAMDERGRAWTLMFREKVLIEAFDAPYVALDVDKGEEFIWSITMPYGHTEKFYVDTLCLDEWDRYHGRTVRGVPFVFTRAAQARFFNLVDEFEDDAVTIDGKRIETAPWLTNNPESDEAAWWSNVYRTEEPRWELNRPSQALPALVPQLKLPKLRVLVLGSGSGNDAAWFAEKGHIVTAVDFSEEAIVRARKKYAHLSNLTLLQSDVFHLPASMNGAFDLVFEHTLYCAITPSKRNDLVSVWRRVLAEQGHLMGVFFTMDKPKGPPFGGSEWEIRARLNKAFKPLYWTRLRDSIDRRIGHELFVYALKTTRF